MLVSRLSQKLLKNLVGKKDAAAGEAEDSAFRFEQTGVQETLDGGGEAQPCSAGSRPHAFHQTQTDEEALLVRPGFDRSGRGSGPQRYSSRLSGFLAAHAAIEGMEASAPKPA